MVLNETKCVNKIQKYVHSQNLKSLGPKLSILAFLAIIWPKMPKAFTNWYAMEPKVVTKSKNMSTAKISVL